MSKRCLIVATVVVPGLAFVVGALSTSVPAIAYAPGPGPQCDADGEFCGSLIGKECDDDLDDCYCDFFFGSLCDPKRTNSWQDMVELPGDDCLLLALVLCGKVWDCTQTQDPCTSDLHCVGGANWNWYFKLTGVYRGYLCPGAGGD